MSLFKPLVEGFPLDRQMRGDAAPVVLANIFTMAPADEQDYLAAWKHDIGVLRQQQGFISVQMHRAIGDNPTYLVYAVWESVAAFLTAFTHPDSIATLAGFPASVVSRPHLFQKIAIPGVCVA